MQRQQVRLTGFWILAVTAALAAAGCSVQPRITNKPTVQVDQYVDTSPLQIYLMPKARPDSQEEFAVFVAPFFMGQDMNNGAHVGRELTRVFWQKWLSMEVFPTIAYDPGLAMRGPAQVVREARSRGADLAVAGTVTHFLQGGAHSDSNVSLRLDIFDVATGNPIWSMEQTGVMASAVSEDYIFFTRKVRLPQEPVFAIMSAIAEEMGTALVRWQAEPQYEAPVRRQAPGGNILENDDSKGSN
jgi:OOP family OmpA-OmpF porin